MPLWPCCSSAGLRGPGGPWCARNGGRPAELDSGWLPACSGRAAHARSSTVRTGHGISAPGSNRPRAAGAAGGPFGPSRMAGSISDPSRDLRAATDGHHESGASGGQRNPPEPAEPVHTGHRTRGRWWRVPGYTLAWQSFIEGSTSADSRAVIARIGTLNDWRLFDHLGVDIVVRSEKSVPRR